MCNNKHCNRPGCENHIPENRNDCFCSNACSKSNKIMKFVALSSAYRELPISITLVENANSIKRIKKICAFNGCENKVSARGKKRKFCSHKCYANHYTKKRICDLGSCEKEFRPYRKGMKYCSRVCYVKSVQSADRFCINKMCGKKLETKNQKKYCSQSCFYNHKHGYLTWNHICQKAGCENKLTDKRSSRKYCSHECYKKAQFENANTTGRIKMVKRKGWTYPRRFVKTETGWKLLSVFTWEQHNGPLPSRHIVTFNDGNSFNDQDISNLSIISTIKNLLIKRANKLIAKEGELSSSEKFYSKDHIVI